MASPSRDRALLLGVCLAGLVLRLVVVWQCAGAGLFSDMQDYYDRAIYLRDHGAFFPDAFRPPAYPAVLAGLSLLFGDHVLLAARVFQAVLGAIDVGLVGLLAGRLAGARAGLAAAAILAVYPAWLLYPVYIMAETLFTFFTLLGVWLWAQRGYWTAALSGLALALSVQSRAVGVATVAGIGIAAAIEVIGRMRAGSSDPAPGAVPGSRIVARFAVLVAAFAVTLTPWVVRNAYLLGAFIPTDTASGYNFLLGNNPLATGRLELDQLPAVTAKYWGHPMTDADRSAAGMTAGMAFIRSAPGAASVLAVRKMGYLVGLEGREHAWTYSYYFHGQRAAATVWAWGLALLVSFPLVLVAALAGMLRPQKLSSLGRTIVIVLAVVALLHLASFGESRFHVPWVPLLAVMAGTLWDSRPSAPWPASRRAVLAVAVAALVMLWMTQAPALLERLALLASSTTPLGLPY